MNILRIDLCQACLSDDRPLYPLSQLTSILREIHFFQDIKVLNISGAVCWECKYLMIKWSKFKKQVLQAQYILYHDLKTQLKYIGNLSRKTNKEFDYKFNDKTDNIEQQENVDPLSPLEENLENKLNIKVEQTVYGHVSNDDALRNKQNYLLNDTEDNKGFVKELDNHGNNNVERVSENDMLNGFDETKVNSEVLDEGEIDNDKALFDNEEDDTEEETVKQDKVRRKETNKPKKTVVDTAHKKKDDETNKYIVTVFTDEELMMNREKKMNHPNFKKMPFKCEPCVLGFLKKETYDVHMEKKHDETVGPHKCPVCKIHFATSTTMDKHVQKHYVSYSCKLCKYVTVLYCAIVSHCANKHGSDETGSIHCDKCDFVGRTPTDLTEHTQTEHALSCNDCGVKFKRKGDLRKHRLVIHASDRQHKCEICSKTFKTERKLETHSASHSGALSQQLSYCRVCKVQYKNIYVYRSHLRNSPKHCSNVYQCKDCYKRFPSKVMWRKHYAFYHLKKSKHSCGTCNKLFLSRSRLKAHQQTHHGLSRTRNHCCDVCNKKFFIQSTLRTHYLTHMSQRNYMCDQCGDSFKQRASFHTHVRLLHKTKKAAPSVDE